MDCPVCREPMIVMELNQVEIDHCLECKGVWLDADELNQLLNDPVRVNQVMEAAQVEGNPTIGKRKCPICRKKMDEIIVESEKKTHIDRCPEGHGLWFDHGEFGEVIEYIDRSEKKIIAAALKDFFKY